MKVLPDDVTAYRRTPEFSEVTVTRNLSQVSIVGEELAADLSLTAGLFQVLARLGIKIEMISFGATRNNLSFVIKDERVTEVVKELHAELFGGD